MNNRMLNGKPLYVNFRFNHVSSSVTFQVALAQRKEDRRAQLASQYIQRYKTVHSQCSHFLTYASAKARFFPRQLHSWKLFKKL